MTPELLKSFVLTMAVIVAKRSASNLADRGFLRTLNDVIRLDEDWEWVCEAGGPSLRFCTTFRFKWISNQRVLRFTSLGRAGIPTTLPEDFQGFPLFNTVFPEGNIRVMRFANVIEYYL